VLCFMHAMRVLAAMRIGNLIECFFFRLMWLNSDQRGGGGGGGGGGGETERNVAFIENGTSIEWRRNTIYKLVYEP